MTDESLDAMMQDEGYWNSYDAKVSERADAFVEFTAGLLDERTSRAWKEHEFNPFN